jgi:hypothetical protein
VAIGCGGCARNAAFKKAAVISEMRIVVLTKISGNFFLVFVFVVPMSTTMRTYHSKYLFLECGDALVGWSCLSVDFQRLLLFA